MLAADGSAFQVTTIDTTATFGALDLEVHYTPDTSQVARLRDPPTARKQVTAVMTALLALHPELQDAFHGIWCRRIKILLPSFRWNCRWTRLFGTEPPAQARLQWPSPRNTARMRRFNFVLMMTTIRFPRPTLKTLRL